MSNRRGFELLLCLLCAACAVMTVWAQADTPPPPIGRVAEATLDLRPSSATQTSDGTIPELAPYRWDRANLAVFVPVTARVQENANEDRLWLVVSGDNHTYHYIILNASVDEQALYELLDNEMRALGLTLTTYERLTLYGRLGWRIDAYRGASEQVTRGRIGKLPDNRPLLIIAEAQHETLNAHFDALTYGLAFNVNGIPHIPAQFPPPQLGNEMLIKNTPVQGELSQLSPVQTWYYTGEAGAVITLNAVDLSRTHSFDLALDMAIRIFAPSGEEIAYNDDQAGIDLFGAYDAQVRDLHLVEDGVYTVQVEWVQGAGTYTLGVRRDRPLVMEADGSTVIYGYIEDAFPVERWVFDVHADQQFSFTLFAENGTLDPALELVTLDGQTLAYNDDAPDTSLGETAQLNGVRFPADGAYVVEVSRFAGSGAYRLIVVATN